MSPPQLAVPLRVPELGPQLGKLVVGTGRTPGGFSLDAYRYRLVSRLLMAAGEARRLAARGDRAPALLTLGRTSWLEAWEEAAAGVSDAVIEQVDRHLAAEAETVGMPRRLRARIQLDPAERRAIAARMGSAGARLVPVLDDLEGHCEAVLRATPSELDAVEAWQETLKTAARRLEAAWLELEDAVDEEVARWRRTADEIACWRRSLWPGLVVAAGVLTVAVWLGLVFGGYLPTPAWLASVWRALP